MTAAIGVMWTAIRRAASATTASASGSPALAPPKIAGTAYGGSSVEGSRLFTGQPGGEGGDGRRTRVIGVLPLAAQRVVELARGAAVARDELAANDQPGAETGPHRQEGEVLHAPADAPPALADGGQVDVILDRDADPEARLQIPADLEPLEARRCSPPAELFRWRGR